MSAVRVWATLSVAALVAPAACTTSASAPWPETEPDAGGGSEGGGVVVDAGRPPNPGDASAADAGDARGGAADVSSGEDSGQPTSACPPSWTTTAACGGGSTPPGPAPDFGPHVLIFDPSTPMNMIQSQLDTVDGMMEQDQFDNNGYAYLFKPGQYSLDVRVGFYVHVIGIGQSPDDVVISGAVRSKANLPNGNATCNFWRTVENVAVAPTQAIDNGTDVWAVSQGTSMRRVHIKGSIALVDTEFPGQNWASGGFIADSVIDTQIDSGVQQQFLTRNDDLASWVGSNWNMVFVGDKQTPQGTWPSPPYTVAQTTPVIREKPFLYVDTAGNYLVMVPYLKTNSTGSSWAGGTPPGSPLSIDRFYVAKPGSDSASTLNAALAQGKHLLLTPGDYQLDSPLHVTQPNTVVLGLGFPTLTPSSGNAVVSIDDVDGVSIAGILIEAGSSSSATLLEAGAKGSSTNHSSNPTVLFDVHCRIGGNISGTAASCFTINSSDVVIDNAWLWRADHGAGADWNTNKSDNGIIVNGDRVTAYGLFAEHFQNYQTLWNGEDGSVYFYQSEMPYDPPSQGDWMSSSSENGYPSYKVSDTVTRHLAQGLGVYSVFQNNITADNAFETPSVSGVSMHHMVTASLGSGTIKSIWNGTGNSVGNGTQSAFSTQ